VLDADGQTLVVAGSVAKQEAVACGHARVAADSAGVAAVAAPEGVAVAADDDPILGANRTTNANMLSLCCEFLKPPQGRWFQRFG
jgi:hypothetical protein